MDAIRDLERPLPDPRDLGSAIRKHRVRFEFLQTSLHGGC